MDVAVIGGTGTLGAPMVAELAARGDSVRVLTRSVPAVLPSGAVHHRVDLTNGKGLGAALAGVEVVVDAANSQKLAEEVLVEGTKRVLAAGAEQGVRHHVAISVVGAERTPMRYHRAKLAQEEAVAAGAVPWSLLRATQFHDYLGWAFGEAARRHLRPTGAARLQPIDVDVVAARLADVAHSEPGGRLPDLAGPEVGTLSRFSGLFGSRDGRTLMPLRIPSLGKAGRALRDGALTEPEAAAGGRTFEEWLARA